MICLDITNINNHAQDILRNEDLEFDREGSTLYWWNAELMITIEEHDFYNMKGELSDWLGEFYFEGGDDAESSYYTGSYK